MTVQRRRFIVKAGGALVAAGAATVVDTPNVIAQPKIQCRMSTAWTQEVEIYHAAAERMAKVVEGMSGGRFRIEVFPGGQIMGPLDCFDAASQGKIEAFYAAGIFWDAKEPASQWFTTSPSA
jgi:TRAP-type mannitol/chloroaromatic compound transport system substrate-binding protein